MLGRYLCGLLLAGLLAVGLGSEPAVEDCGGEFGGIYSGCRRVRATLPDSDKEADAIERMLPDALTASVHVIIVQYGKALLIEEVGRMSDRFLQSRPQWTVYHEEYSWQMHRTHHLIYIRLSNIDRPLIQVAEILNPSDCSSRPLVFKGYHDFDEYGNEHINIGGYSNTFLGTISLVHIHEHAKFIDDGYCPNEINKYNCAFLPMTNCPLPKHYFECTDHDQSCIPWSHVYSSAAVDAHLIYKDFNSNKFRRSIQRPRIDGFSVVGDEYLSRAVFDFEHVSKRKYSMDGIGSLFYTGIFFRRNYDFRAQTAKMIHNFRHTTQPNFGPNQECVAIHIRHHDRVKPGYDMIKYCNEFVRRPDNTCYNRTNGAPIEPDCQNYWDHNYACASAVPFGGITMEAYLKAAELLMDNPKSGSKTVFIVTDDGAWVEQESKPFLGEWAMQVLPAQPNHRSRATINGVTLFASIELLQQCSGLVGHSVSAFTTLLRALMCIRHGPKNNLRFGECPKFYDFAKTAG